MRVLEYFMDLYDEGEREVGLEIEMEGVNTHLPELHYWHQTDDGSLRGEGAVEYVLKRPGRRAVIPARLTYLQRELERHGSQLMPSDRCGVHVHINCQPLTIAELYRFITLFLIFEALIVRWCGEDREGNMFCLRSSDARLLLKRLVQAKQDGRLYRLCNDNFRYSALNLAALAKYGSVEFRSMRTPEDFTRIETFVKILLAIKDAALESRDEREFVETLSHQGPEAFARLVLGDLMDELWVPGAERVLTQGVRQAQHLAYTQPRCPLKKPGPMDLLLLENMGGDFDDADEFPMDEDEDRSF